MSDGSKGGQEDPMTQYMSFIHKSRYARWLDKENRRETWTETVDRYISFMTKDKGLEDSVIEELREGIRNLDVMPSMRCLMTAGRALERDNVAGFNCSYIAIDNARCFDELMYILMCGTGVGFSVERQYINTLPTVAEDFHTTDTVIHVADSKIGWAKSFKELVSLLYIGQVPKWDVSKVRHAGAKLKTFGGRASGPEPLEDLFKYSVSLFRKAKGRKLNSLECHDLCCKIADIVVVGGVRRSALISLSNLTDDRMRGAKSGQWWETEGQRALSNNSVCYTEKPDMTAFMKEWSSLHESKSGERGMFSRVAAKKQAAKNGRRDIEHEFGTNPCSEIILRPNAMCNLSEVVIRSTDTLEDLQRKVRLATILGTLQATLVNFRYLRNIWKKNTEEEALLGVSLTGIMDHPVLSKPGERSSLNRPGHATLESWDSFDPEELTFSTGEALGNLKGIAISTNKKFAEKLGINQATAITCVKPSGTVSQLVDSASGIHPRFSSHYIRTVRANKRDPLAKWMEHKGFPVEQSVTNENDAVFSFPQKAPSGATVTKDLTAMEQLELWKVYQDNWCEHKPSITVFYKDEEFLKIGAWLYDNFDDVSGVSFLPHTDHVYQQAPYQEITEEIYETLVKELPEVSWEDASEFEHEDSTTGSQELACTGGVCEIVDLSGM